MSKAASKTATALRSKVVDIEGVGEVEFREPLFDAIAPYLGSGDSQELGLHVLRLSAYRGGERIFAGEVGLSTGMALLRNVKHALEVCGLSDEKKDLPTESE